MFDACPGSQKFKKPTPEFIKCKTCQAEVEMWTDEIQVICRNCKAIVKRNDDISCLDWCKSARECVGDKIYNNYLAHKTVTLKEKVLKELGEYFGEDIKRVDHAKSVLGYAEELLKLEPADWNIVIPASILHDVGIKIAEQKYGSSAGHYQEKEGPAIARQILIKLGVNKDDIDEICEIIGRHHTPGEINTKNFAVLYDADWLVNIKEEVDLSDKEKVAKLIDKVFLTSSGKELAKGIYLKQ